MSSKNKQRILITGVSGLIGRILFNYLISIEEYEVFGVDQHLNISSRYDNQLEKNQSIEKKYPLLKERFFQCDITNRIEFHRIIQQQQIQIIIHLAAVLENHSDLQHISHVNIQGTKNVFEAPNVDRILFASSVRTVFGYLRQEPYHSIYTDTFNDETMLNNLQKLTTDDYPPYPLDETPGDQIYCQTKIVGEQMSREILRTTSKSIICIRLGWVTIDDQPGLTWLRTVWLSYRDLCSFIHQSLQSSQLINGIYFAISDNYRSWLDIDKAKRDLGFIPIDGARRIS